MNEASRWRRSSALPRILCVDDEPVILQLLARILEQQKFEVARASNAAAALRTFDSSSFDIVLTDIHMPGGDGLGLMHELRRRDPSLPVVVITGHGTVDTAVQALRDGATGMLVKPFTADELLTEIRRALESVQLHYEAMQFRFLSPVLDSIALTLSTAIEARHLETGEHCRQLGVLAERMALALGLDARQQMTLRIGGYLHDIGKIGIADAILLKPGKLTDAEMTEMRRHSEIGAEILGVHETMTDIADIVRHHHERWDGQGYPGRLAAKTIPLGARVIAVADAFSAMTTDRIYRAAMSTDRAWAELRAHAGAQFDPEVVEVFALVVDEEGRLRPLDPDAEARLGSPVHVPDRLAPRPGFDGQHAAGAASGSLPAVPAEPCPVADATRSCAVVESGEGCEIVVQAGTPEIRSAASTRELGSRQVA